METYDIVIVMLQPVLFQQKMQQITVQMALLSE